MAYYSPDLDYDTGYHIDEIGEKHDLKMIPITLAEYRDLVSSNARNTATLAQRDARIVRLTDRLREAMSLIPEYVDLPDSLRAVRGMLEQEREGGSL